MFSTIDKFIGGALFLIFVYLVVFNADKSQTILASLGNFTTSTFKTLQGR